MIKAQEVVKASPRYLGTPYNELDCQAYVEAVLKDVGISVNLAGSNAWFREVKAHGWVGTPNECKAKYGSIPPGAFLFVLKQDGKEPAKYQGDGIGNANHIGIYTGLSGEQMCAMGGVTTAYDFGNGAINSSKTRGFVCTSKFAGKAINGGWNMVGLWNKIDYGFGETETPSTTPGTTSLPVLRKGDKGQYVTLLQTKLINKGFSCGSYGADGDFGNDTEKAVKSFQKAYGLTVDGIVGAKTWSALEGQTEPIKTYIVTIKGLSAEEAAKLANQYRNVTVSEE